MLATLEYIKEMNIKDIDVILRVMDWMDKASKYLNEYLAFKGLLDMLVRGIIIDTTAWMYADLGEVVL